MRLSLKGTIHSLKSTANRIPFCSSQRHTLVTLETNFSHSLINLAPGVHEEVLFEQMRVFINNVMRRFQSRVFPNSNPHVLLVYLP
jgi:hypothetical protein